MPRQMNEPEASNLTTLRQLIQGVDHRVQNVHTCVHRVRAHLRDRQDGIVHSEEDGWYPDF